MTKTIALATVSGLALVLAGYMIFVFAPTEAVQGDVQRIFYLHAPAAIAAYACFAVVLAGALAYLWRGSLAGDRLARSAAPVGLVFTSVVLIMGSLWAKPIWGAYWIWDARVTATAVLWLIYSGYLLVRRVAGPGRQAARLSAVVGIVGFVDVPVVHFSVSWWRTVHPPLEAGSRFNMAPEMWLTFMVTMVAVLLLAATLLTLRYQLELLKEQVAALRGGILQRAA